MVWLQVFLKAWNFFIELQDYKHMIIRFMCKIMIFEVMPTTTLPPIPS